MNESVLMVIILIAVLIPCAIAYLLVRFLPRLRYLPSVLLLIVAFGFLLSAFSTKVTGGGISGFGDLPIFAEMAIGGVCALAAGAVFFISWVMYHWLGPRHDE
jgi:hypothetical protein